MPIATWPAVLLKDARDLLHGLDSETLIQIAEELELALREYSQPYNFPPDKSHWIWSRVLPGWTSAESISSSENIRKNFEDLNLFLAFYRPRDFQADSRLNFAATEWQLLAVLAIWKLIDAFDASFRSDGMERAPINRKPVDALSATAALAMEAQAAVAHAVQIKLRARHITELEEMRSRNEAANRSKKGTSAVTVRHQKMDSVRLAAFALADKGKFESQPTAAEAISNNVEISPGKFVPYQTAYRWLLKRKDWEDKIANRAN